MLKLCIFIEMYFNEIKTCILILENSYVLFTINIFYFSDLWLNTNNVYFNFFLILVLGLMSK